MTDIETLLLTGPADKLSAYPIPGQGDTGYF